MKLLILFQKKFKFIIKQILPPFFLNIIKKLNLYFLNGGSTGYNYLDLKLIQKIKPQKNGFFVELGANNGVFQSNTYKLQKEFNWTGILIEPNQKRFIECIKNRSFKKKPKVFCNACVPFEYKDKFVEIEYADLMSVAKNLNVGRKEIEIHTNKGTKFLESSECRHSFGAIAKTLTDILNESLAPTNFDLLSLDVEGNELAVLKGLDFNKYNPKWILVETRNNKVKEYLEKRNYNQKYVLSKYENYSDVLFEKGNL